MVFRNFAHPRKIRDISGQVGGMRNDKRFRVFPHCRFHLIVIDPSRYIRRNHGKLQSLFFQCIQRAQNGIMLADCRDHMIPRPEESENCRVQCLRIVARKCNPLRTLRVKQLCQPHSRLKDDAARIQCRIVCTAACISTAVQCLDHTLLCFFWMPQRRCRRIEVNHGLITRSALLMRSTMSYMLVTLPTCNFSVMP